MARKQPKVIRNNKPIVDVEKQFNEAVEGMKLIIRAQQRNVNRIDNMVECSVRLHDWELDDGIENVNKMIDLEEKEYDIAMDIVSGLKLEDFKKEDMDDPVAPFIPDRFGVQNRQEMYEAYVSYRCLRPLGERIENLHRLVIETIEQNEKTDNA